MVAPDAMPLSEQRAQALATLRQAHESAQRGQVLQAEKLATAALAHAPGQAHALLGQLALSASDGVRAAMHFDAAAAAEADNPQHGLDGAFARLADGRLAEAKAGLESMLSRHASCAAGWLMLGQVMEALDDAPGALRSFHLAVSRARAAGQWLDRASTPPEMLDAVMHAIQVVRQGKRNLFYGSYDSVRARHGAQAVRRIDKALAGYLKEQDLAPSSPHQRPRFLYVPDLPEGPYHDANLHPWARQLREAFEDIRADALRTLAEDNHFENFIQFREQVKVEDYLRGHGRPPAWEALFFYRHGKRYDAHHARCPITSALLESIALCRIEEEAPEICFSVLAPRSDILPHHGVTNGRLVMHLPLLVPSGCALNVHGGGEHPWREGEPMMFDDTYRHEAWNRSDQPRVILLMDCWNPYLDEAERAAFKLLVETIGALGRADKLRQH